MNFDITSVVVAVIYLLVALITAFLVPWLRKKLGDNKWDELVRVVKILVRAAEQLIKGDKRGNERLAFVLEKLKECGFDIDATMVREVIEAEVYKLTKEESDDSTE